MTRLPNRADERVAELLKVYAEEGLDAAKLRFLQIQEEDSLKTFEVVVIAGRFRQAAGL